MQLNDLRKIAFSLYAPALFLEKVFPKQMRRPIKSILTIVVVALLALYATATLSQKVGGGAMGIALVVGAFGPQIVGLLSLAIAAWLILMALDFFSHSFFFQDLDLVLEAHASMPLMTAEVAQVVSEATSDPLSGLLRTEAGLETFARVGLLPEDMRNFYTSRRNAPPLEAFQFDMDTPLSLSRFIQVVYEGDKELQNFLFTRGVLKEDLYGAVAWAEDLHRSARKKARWWSKDELGRVPGIGKDWAYGEIYLLEKYGMDMLYHPSFRTQSVHTALGSKEVEELETILSRARESNALLVGEAGAGVIDIIARFTHEIQEGKILPPLEGKRVFLLNSEVLIASAKEKGVLEEEFITLMHQVIAAGNIILVFENIVNVMKSADALGVNIVELLSPFLESPGVQIIATASPSELHDVIEKNGALTQGFEVVQMDQASGDAVLDVMKRYVKTLEMQYGVFFTFQSVREMITAAEQYLPYGVMPNKAIDLAAEITSAQVARSKPLIEKKDVQNFISAKTGVPIGDISGGERAALMDLEKTLADRVIGQPEATKAVASAMRRARAGTRSAKRPMGTFLFLGPTGVGKTETAKALAELFFRKSDAMIRIQMPEYRGPDALERLIGSFETGKSGVLTAALKERPYGVLLLDEFEKTTDEVLNLFLQILDEGQFSDASGKKVDAHNVIMIATSNAGADLIWEYFKKNESPSSHRDELVDGIIKRGIFKPELLNRFDGVVVFNPLSEDMVRKIARLQLEGLVKRLKDKGVEFVVNDAAVDAVVKSGYQPEFGARAMQRAISEKVEQALADRMIRGDIKPGERVELSPSDFA